MIADSALKHRMPVDGDTPAHIIRQEVNLRILESTRSEKAAARDAALRSYHSLSEDVRRLDEMINRSKGQIRLARIQAGLPAAYPTQPGKQPARVLTRYELRDDGHSMRPFYIYDTKKRAIVTYDSKPDRLEPLVRQYNEEEAARPRFADRVLAMILGKWK